MTANSILTYLESCPKTPEWGPYIQAKARVVQARIEQLRAFAERKPSHVADLVNAEIATLEKRLACVLAQELKQCG